MQAGSVVQVQPEPDIDTRVSPRWHTLAHRHRAAGGPRIARIRHRHLIRRVLLAGREAAAMASLAISAPAGWGVMVVESRGVRATDPPPDTLTAFTCGEVAFAATFTVTVIGE